MKFHLPVRVYYEDTDAEGVVYYANYLKYFERARTEWLRARDVDLAALQAGDGVVFVVADAVVKYRRPARLNDLLQVTAEVARPGAAQLRFEQAAVREDDGEVLCEATFRVACVAHGDFLPRRIPKWVQEKIRCATT